MYRYIGIEDLVASALIELMKREKSNRKVSLCMIMRVSFRLCHMMVLTILNCRTRLRWKT